MNYFILVNDIQQGPFSLEELRQQHIRQDTLVWTDGMPQWVPAWQVDELRQLLFEQSSDGNAPQQPQQPTPPPPPPHSNQAYGSYAYAQGPQPQGFRADGTTPPYKPRKKKGKGCMVSLVVIAIIAFLLALTNPGIAEHRKAIAERIDEMSTSLDGIEDPTVRVIAETMTGMGGGIVKGMLREVVNNNLEYHNYIFFSTTTLHTGLADKDIKCSTGCLGYVYAVNLAKIVKDHIANELTGGNDTAVDNTAVDEEEEAPDYDQQQQSGTTNGSRIDSLTHKVTKHIASKVADEVKKQVRQGTDSSTASGIGSIIDDVVRLITNE